MYIYMNRQKYKLPLPQNEVKQKKKQKRQKKQKHTKLYSIQSFGLLLSVFLFMYILYRYTTSKSKN